MGISIGSGIGGSGIGSSGIGGSGISGSSFSPTHFVSQSATNGYAVGNDTNDGLSKNTPWLTVTKAISSAPAGSVVAINDGTYAAATFYFLTTSLTLIAENNGQVVLQGGASTRVFNFRPASGIHTFIARGIIFDAESTADSCVEIGISTSTADAYVQLIGCTFKDMNLYGVTSSQQKSADIRISGCSIETTTSTAFAAGLFVDGIESGRVYVNGFDITATTSRANPKYGVYVVGAGTEFSTHISGVTGTLTASSATGTHSAVTLVNTPAPTVESCNVETVSVVGGFGPLLRLFCNSASLNSSSATIRNNTLFNNTDGGHVILVGQESTSVGDNRQNNAHIYGNNVQAKNDSATPTHGIMLGFGTGGIVEDNTITGAKLATLSKGQTGGIFRRNSISECGSEFIRAKGSDGTIWLENILNYSAGFAGNGIVVNADDGPVHSTNIEITSNTLNISHVPTKIVNVATSSDATFSDNLYNITGTLVVAEWEYQGTTYDSLAEWKAAIEPDARP